MSADFSLDPYGPTRLNSRREFLARNATGFGLVALSGLLADDEARAASLRAPGVDFEAKAKNVIFLYMSGGVSQVDSFDPKPRLNDEHGKPMPVPVQRTQFNQNGNIFGTPFEFRQWGECGMPISNMFPNVAQHADKLAVIRSMTTAVNEHAQGNFVMHTGFPVLGHPAAGAWMNYGLGTDNQNLPGYVVLQSGKRCAPPHGGVGLFSSGYLPAQHQASIIQIDQPQPVRNIRPRVADKVQRRRLALIQNFDKSFAARVSNDAQVEAAVRNYETAFRMQSAVPELCDLSGETEATKKMYGIEGDTQTAAYGRQALLARRLVERGVRFVELSCLPQHARDGQAANPWDQHGSLEVGHTNMSKQIDKPIAGLLADLDARGLLGSTLVVWAGEFGRTPFTQGRNGRDHNPMGYSVWLAGGGTKSGIVYGATDDYGYYAIENKCTIYDLWATVLHLAGINHKKLTFRFGGRDFRLTDVHGNVLDAVIA